MGIFGMTDMGRFMIITMCSIVFLVFIMRVIGRNTGKRDEFMDLVKDGNFKEAIDYCQDQIDSGNLQKRKLARVYLDQAIAYQRVGMFQKSLECLETMNPGYLRKEESMAFNTYYAMNLMFMHKRNEEAIRYIGRTWEFNRYKRRSNLHHSNYLIMAHLDLDRKNRRGADALVEEVRRIRMITKERPLADYALRRYTTDFNDCQERFLMGWYYERTKEYPEAAMFYKPVTEFRYDCFYTEKARDFMANYEGEVEEEPNFDVLAAEFRQFRAVNREKKKMERKGILLEEIERRGKDKAAADAEKAAAKEAARAEKLAAREAQAETEEKEDK